MLDYNDLFDRHEAEQERQLAKLPRCCECGKRIQDDYYYDFFGDIYCESCMEKNFRHSTDDYIDE